jgi:chromosomal replication initiator protein
MESFWDHCLRHFEKSLPAQQYKTWIQPLQVRLEDEKLTVSAPNRFALEWVKDKFLGDIERLCSKSLNKNIEVVLTLSEKVVEKEKAVVVEIDAPATKPKVKEQSRLNPSFTFDSFVTGKANQLARAAAIQVAEHPGWDWARPT